MKCRRKRRRLPDAAGTGSGGTTRLISIPYDVITRRKESWRRVRGRKEAGEGREWKAEPSFVRNNGGRESTNKEGEELKQRKGLGERGDKM